MRKRTPLHEEKLRKEREDRIDGIIAIGGLVICAFSLLYVGLMMVR